MIKRNQDGAVNAVVISLIFAVVMLTAAVAFGGWAYISRQDYKDNTDAKISDAVVIAKQQESTAKDKQFVEKEKNPLRTYQGPDAYGSIVVKYPKTWSAYVSEASVNGGASPLDGYFHPATVPSTTDANSIFALRVQAVSQAYSQAITPYTSLQKAGKVTVSAYALPQVPKVVGVRITGTLVNGKTGTTIILPLRSGAIQISTFGNQYTNDFDNIILPNLTFSP